MSDERWMRIDQLLQSALGRPPHEREAFIRDACPDDDGVRDEVLSLLAHAGSADQFLEPPPAREPLPPGARLGAYEIRARIGAGGMGEVYRAHDSRLRRDIALKILPPEAADAERRQRFEREAQAVAALNHPNIVTIHSVEQSGDLHFLTMELVDGRTLVDLLPRDGLPIDRLLEIAIPLADAIAAAHARGVIHRDLKPANVMVTTDGRVKVLDFGLAKLRPEKSSAGDATKTSRDSTIEGRLLGTVVYMSPEQAEGRAIDHRSDIFSLGVVLYELATGRRPFQADSTVSLLAAIVRDTPPPVTELKPALLRELGRLVRRCLIKDPNRRYQSALDVRNELEEIQREWQSGELPAPTPVRARVRYLIPGAAVVLAAGMALGVWVSHSRAPSLSIAPEHVQFGVAPADGLERLTGLEVRAASGRPSRTALALSPDGRFLVFVGTRNGVSYLFRRAFESPTTEIIPGTEGADVPFISPDSSRLGFWAAEALHWMPLEGGTIQNVVRVERVHSASWADERTIVYGLPAGVMRVDVGGEPQRLTSIDREAGETWHDFPQVLAGGRALVLTVHSGYDLRQSKVVSYRIDAKQYAPLADNATDGRVVAGGRYLLFMRDGALMGAPFDAHRLTTTGPAVKLIDDVMVTRNTLNTSNETGAGQFAVSDSGHLVYLSGGVYPNQQNDLAWFDRRGNPLGLPVPVEKLDYASPRLAPDGRILACLWQSMDQDRGGILIYDPIRDSAPRQRFDGRVDWPIWTPDFLSVVFSGTVKGRSAIFKAPADGSAPAAPLTAPLTPFSEFSPAPASWSENGTELLFWQSSGVFKLAIDSGKITPVLESTPQVQYQYPALSPDGRWLAYTMIDSGRQEVWVAPYPSLRPRRPVSTQGGHSPLWTRYGGSAEIVYYERIDAETGRLMSVVVSEGSLPRPVELFKKSGWVRTMPMPGFAVTPDGERFLTVVRDRTRYPPPATIDVVFHWLDTLPARLMGAAR